MNSIERDSMLGIYRALYDTNAPLDFIHIDRLSQTNLKQYRLVFAPYPLMIPEASAVQFREYVRNGGHLVAEARFGWNNEKGAASPTIPGLGLHEVMGCRETDVQTGEAGRTTLKWTSTELPGFAPGELLPARWYEETLAPARPNSHVVAAFPNGAAAAVISSYGTGKTLMLGSYVGAAYETRRDSAAVRFYSALLRWAGVEPPVTVADAAPEVRYLESGRNTLVFAINHGAKPINPAISIRLAGASYRGVDLANGRPVETTQANGRVSFRGEIGPEDVWVVLLSPR